MKKNINQEMIAASYDYAKKLYHKQISQGKALDNIVAISDMHRGSALAYISDFQHMMEGKEYQRTMKTNATQYYLENIYKDYGIESLRLAVNAVDQHTKYYSTHRKGSLRSIEAIVREFNEKFLG
jgi:hypothetical protein